MISRDKRFSPRPPNLQWHMRSLWVLCQGCSLFNRSSGFTHQKLQYKCPELNLTQVHGSPTCFVAVRLALEQTCKKKKKKKIYCRACAHTHTHSARKKKTALFSCCTQGYSHGLNATFDIQAFPLINWEAASADLKSCEEGSVVGGGGRWRERRGT